jgi:hypothetical protein
MVSVDFFLESPPLATLDWGNISGRLGSSADALRILMDVSDDVIMTRQSTPALRLDTHLDRRLSASHRQTSTDDQGYALIEYAQKEEAEKAIKETSGTTFLEKTIHA